MNTVELFIGAGGLALGIHDAGFVNKAVIDFNKNACDTLRANQKRAVKEVSGWPIHEMDVKRFSFESIKDDIELVAGGPPCQPFSNGGKHRGSDDKRDMFPEMIRAVRELTPRAVIIENVKGLLREKFATYFEYICLQLTYPIITKLPGEEWADHLSRLERYHTAGGGNELQYNVVYQLLNAAQYGVPQKRERVFIVAFRSDLGIEWSFPKPTHSFDSLLWDQWVSGEYWDRHEIARKRRPKIAERYKKRVKLLSTKEEKPVALPWRTVRDAVSDLPNPRNRKEASVILNHTYNPGARVYKGHTGSPLDLPAKTLKAGDHGVPGGENMLVYPNKKVRYFSVRESARLQTFPDHYYFCGAWTEAMRQIGNAVPVKLASVVATSIKEQLETTAREN